MIWPLPRVALGAGTIARNNQAVTPSPTSAPPFWTPLPWAATSTPAPPSGNPTELQQDDPPDISSWRAPAGLVATKMNYLEGGNGSSGRKPASNPTRQISALGLDQTV
jgi:hypothetical protein